MWYLEDLGAAIHKAMSVKMLLIAVAAEFYGQGEGEHLIKGVRRTNGYSLSSETGEIPEELQRYSSVTIWVRSTKLACGYGYAVDAEGTARPEVNRALLKSAAQGLSKPQIDVQRLRQVLYSSK